MKSEFPILIVTLFFVSCSDDDSEPIPECLIPITEAIMERDVQSPKADIQLYKYNGEQVYQVNGQNFPDGQSHVITLDCNDICVIGGIDGPQNDCPNYENAEFIRIIWTDPR